MLSLILGSLACFNAAKNELKITPTESMRPKAPKAGHRTLIEKIELLWRHLNFSWKMIVRNLFRYKRRMILTLIGIILASSLLLTALGMNDSIAYMINQQFSGIQQYDLKINLNNFLSINELSYINSLPHVIKMEPMTEMGVEIHNGWRIKKMVLVVLGPQSELYRILDQESKPVQLPRKGILLPEKICRLIAFKSGDKAKMRVLWPGKRSDKDLKEVVIQGMVTQYVGQSAYGSSDQIDRFFGEGRIANVVLLRLDDRSNEEAVVSKLQEMASVSSVQSKAELVANLKKAMDTMNSMIIIFILAAGALAFAVTYNITNINISERHRELATLKVLGLLNVK
jgi:putative ABC transport system permease protein